LGRVRRTRWLSAYPGTYKLISSTRKILYTGEVQDTWGKDPNGFIIYGKDERIQT